jgi:isochorismate synthase EntC
MGLVWGSPKTLETTNSLVCIASAENMNQNAWYYYKRCKKRMNDEGFTMKKDTKTNKWFLVYTTPIQKDTNQKVNYKDKNTGEVTTIFRWEAERNQKLHVYDEVIKKLDIILPDNPKKKEDTTINNMISEITKSSKSKKDDDEDLNAMEW